MKEEVKEETVAKIDTLTMIENGFFANYKGTKKSAKSNNIEKKLEETSIKINTEKMLLDLFEIYDSLIYTSKKMNINSETVKLITSNINKLGDCINSLGGKVDKFDPINCVSGLQSPNILKNAEKVISNTKQYYSLGNIQEAKVNDDGKVISIVMCGKDDDYSFKASGTIEALKNWSGSQAIDYIYTRGAGKMFVRAFDNDEWLDKSDDFKISWELEEIPLKEEKEEIKENNKNNITNEEIPDFEIKEENNQKE